MEQETLEEAAERLFPKEKHPTSFETLRRAFISNAVRQQRQQETLEEAGKDFIENTMKYSFTSSETKTVANRMLKCVEFGAKWQQERMYNEKEVESLLHRFMQSQHPDWHGYSTTKWFEQFKKNRVN
jgi:hypothetical protein